MLRSIAGHVTQACSVAEVVFLNLRVSVTQDTTAPLELPLPHQ